MSHEISQLDIADRQLLSKPNVSVWTDIGEAEVTYTIFGKARVRIIHKHDKLRRTILLSTMGLIVVAAMIWQGWVMYQQNESLQSAESSTPKVPSIEVIEPPPLPVYTLHSPAPLPAKNKARAPAAVDVNNPAYGQNRTMQLSPPGLKSEEMMAGKPVAQLPPIAVKPQSAAVATSTIATSNPPIDKPLPRKPFPPRQAAASGVASTAVAPNAASSPAAVTQHVAPLVRESGSSQSHAADKQLADPINVQGK